MTENVLPQLWFLERRIRQEYLQKSYQADDIIFCYGQQPLPFRGRLNGFGPRSDDQQSEDSAIRFSPASLANSGGFVFVTEGLPENWQSTFQMNRFCI